MKFTSALATNLPKRSVSGLKSRWRQLPPALALIVASLLLGNPVLAQETLVKTLTVTGRGEENVQTTKAQVRLGVEVQGKTAQAVQQEVARRSSAVIALLRSRNVEKLETPGINLNPTYDYREGRNILTGFTASNIVSFQVDNARVGTLLDEAVAAGASRIDGISFTAEDQAISQAQQQALREAIQDAQAQAQVVLKALNLTSQEIIGIQINNATVSPPPPQPLQQRLGADSGAASTPVIGGEQEVQGFVTLQIRYGP